MVVVVVVVVEMVTFYLVVQRRLATKFISLCCSCVIELVGCGGGCHVVGRFAQIYHTTVRTIGIRLKIRAIAVRPSNK